MLERVIKLIGEGIAGSPGAISFGTSTLDHKVLDYPVKLDIIVKRLVLPIHIERTLCEAHKIGYRHWCLLVLKQQGDITFIGMQDSIHSVIQILGFHSISLVSILQTTLGWVPTADTIVPTLHCLYMEFPVFPFPVNLLSPPATPLHVKTYPLLQ